MVFCDSAKTSHMAFWPSIRDGKKYGHALFIRILIYLRAIRLKRAIWQAFGWRWPKLLDCHWSQLFSFSFLSSLESKTFIKDFISNGSEINFLLQDDL